jgi:hypothetical protein
VTKHCSAAGGVAAGGGGGGAAGGDGGYGGGGGVGGGAADGTGASRQVGRHNYRSFVSLHRRGEEPLPLPPLPIDSLI